MDNQYQKQTSIKRFEIDFNFQNLFLQKENNNNRYLINFLQNIKIKYQKIKKYFSKIILLGSFGNSRKFNTKKNNVNLLKKKNILNSLKIHTISN